jgi:hypothetical protein
MKGPWKHQDKWHILFLKHAAAIHIVWLLWDQNTCKNYEIKPKHSRIHYKQCEWFIKRQHHGKLNFPCTVGSTKCVNAWLSTWYYSSIVTCNDVSVAVNTWNANKTMVVWDYHPIMLRKCAHIHLHILCYLLRTGLLTHHGFVPENQLIITVMQMPKGKNTMRQLLSRVDPL